MCTHIYTEMQKKLTTCLKCNKIVTVQNKTNQQLLIETLAFYWWHVKFLTKIHHLISLFYSTEQHRVQCQSPFNSVCGHHCFGYRQCIVGAYCLPVFGWIAAGFCPTQSSMSEAALPVSWPCQLRVSQAHPTGALWDSGQGRAQATAWCWCSRLGEMQW